MTSVEAFPRARRGSFREVLLVATRLGLTSFGGPVAHLGYFHQEYVVRRKWLDDETYADLVALCQTMPGPASSQLGIAIGILRAGLPGALAAWVGFTLPSAIALTVFALVVQQVGTASTGWLHGLKIVAVAVVAQAVWTMAKSLTPDRERASIAVAAATVILLAPANLLAMLQVAVILGAGVIGWRWLPPGDPRSGPAPSIPIGRGMAVTALALFFGLLVLLPVARVLFMSQTIALVDSFYRSGALVFGGGHVVLPLLQSEVVSSGWVANDQFLAGYGAAQAVPGPLFTFAAYLGAVMQTPPNGVLGAAIALVAIFLPAFLIIIGTLPAWGGLRGKPAVQAGLRGINASVVGLLVAAFYQSGWSVAILSPADVALALVAFLLLAAWKVPPWLVVTLSALGGVVITQLT